MKIRTLFESPSVNKGKKVQDGQDSSDKKSADLQGAKSARVLNHMKSYSKTEFSNTQPEG